jgi:hypothetical protein
LNNKSKAVDCETLRKERGATSQNGILDQDGTSGAAILSDSAVTKVRDVRQANPVTTTIGASRPSLPAASPVLASPSFSQDLGFVWALASIGG